MSKELVIAVVALAGAGAGGYYWYKKSKTSTNTSTTTTNTSTTPKGYILYLQSGGLSVLDKDWKEINKVVFAFDLNSVLTSELAAAFSKMMAIVLTDIGETAKINTMTNAISSGDYTDIAKIWNYLTDKSLATTEDGAYYIDDFFSLLDINPYI